MDNMPQKEGKILKKTERGFGFISSNGSDGKDIFFHASNLRGCAFDELKVGEVVSFESIQDDRGTNSVNIIVVDLKFEFPPDVIAHVRELNKDLIKHLQKRPEYMQLIHPDLFEKIVAEIYEKEGFTVEMISSWNQADGGVDIIAIRQLCSGHPLRLAIQCKRYRRSREISAEPIRSLASILDRFQAHVEVLATTSYFTRSAEEEVRNHLWRIGLRDYENIKNALLSLRA